MQWQRNSNSNGKSNLVQLASELADWLAGWLNASSIWMQTQRSLCAQTGRLKPADSSWLAKRSLCVSFECARALLWWKQKKKAFAVQSSPPASRPGNDSFQCLPDCTQSGLHKHLQLASVRYKSARAQCGAAVCNEIKFSNHVSLGGSGSGAHAELHSEGARAENHTNTHRNTGQGERKTVLETKPPPKTTHCAHRRRHSISLDEQSSQLMINLSCQLAPLLRLLPIYLLLRDPAAMQPNSRCHPLVNSLGSCRLSQPGTPLYGVISSRLGSAQPAPSACKTPDG